MICTRRVNKDLRQESKGFIHFECLAPGRVVQMAQGALRERALQSVSTLGAACWDRPLAGTSIRGSSRTDPP